MFFVSERIRWFSTTSGCLEKLFGMHEEQPKLRHIRKLRIKAQDLPSAAARPPAQKKKENSLLSIFKVPAHKLDCIQGSPFTQSPAVDVTPFPTRRYAVSLLSLALMLPTPSDRTSIPGEASRRQPALKVGGNCRNLRWSSPVRRAPCEGQG